MEENRPTRQPIAGASSPRAAAEWAARADEVERLRQVARGSRSAFDKLVQEHAGYLFGLAHALSGSHADAEDLVQETLMATLAGRFRGESSLRTWLVGILVRQAAMLRRSLLRRIGRPAEAELPEPAMADPTAAVDARLDLTTLLRRLSPEHREVIVLRELEGMTYAEIAIALGVPRGTVESRLHRARAELRKSYPA